jgi:CBS domain-containing protein
MKVGDVMTKPPVYCDANTNLAAAAEILWNQNCGLLPIVDSSEKLMGVITDRDICVALGTRNRLPSEIVVKEVTSGKIATCKRDDDLRSALATMAEAKVRRLPVIDAAGRLQGILSTDDIVLHTETGKIKRNSELSAEDVVDSLKSIYAAPSRQTAHRRATTA